MYENLFDTLLACRKLCAKMKRNVKKIAKQWTIECVRSRKVYQEFFFQLIRSERTCVIERRRMLYDGDHTNTSETGRCNSGHNDPIWTMTIVVYCVCVQIWVQREQIMATKIPKLHCMHFVRTKQRRRQQQQFNTMPISWIEQVSKRLRPMK